MTTVPIDDLYTLKHLTKLFPKGEVCIIAGKVAAPRNAQRKPHPYWQNSMRAHSSPLCSGSLTASFIEPAYTLPASLSVLKFGPWSKKETSPRSERICSRNSAVVFSSTVKASSSENVTP